MKRIVYILHCVDTEGPLSESQKATFERLYEIFGIKLVPSRENLLKIQNRQIDFGEKTESIARVFSEHNLTYWDDWPKIDTMLLKIMGRDFRNKLPDSFGGGWVYNWHCLDHVGYRYNPRGRDMGFHRIFDHYKQIIERTESFQDGLHWHFHPMSVYKEAHRSATSYVNSPQLYEILCRRIIERNWFPAVFRAGFHAERPDSNWFLEQWIPFDASNWSHRDGGETHQQDINTARLGDWRMAPDDWSIYHPSHDNYQIPGNCRRWICRMLSLKVRDRGLTQNEVDRAFARAAEGKPTIMGITSHDFRDMALEVELAREMISRASRKFPDVRFKFCEAKEAFRSAVYGEEDNPQPLELKLDLIKGTDSLTLQVETVCGKVFGPQPFLALKTGSGRFIHDNFDFAPCLNRWSYTFDSYSIRPDDIEAVGVAANDKYGHSFVKVLFKDKHRYQDK